mgnify:CR=1 FL=1
MLHSLGNRTIQMGHDSMEVAAALDDEARAVVLSAGPQSMALPVVLIDGHTVEALASAIDADPSGFVFAKYGHDSQPMLFKLKSAAGEMYGWCAEPTHNIEGNNCLRFIVGNVVVYVTTDGNGNGVVTTSAL